MKEFTFNPDFQVSKPRSDGSVVMEILAHGHAYMLTPEHAQRLAIGLLFHAGLGIEDPVRPTAREKELEAELAKKNDTVDRLMTEQVQLWKFFHAVQEAESELTDWERMLDEW